MDANFLLITLDSCRWDTYVHARPGFLSQHCPARKAYSQATFTYAAHLAMLQGILPGTRERLPYYNRYSRQLIRIANRPVGPQSLVCFPAGTENITCGFKARGYRTIGIGAMAWFEHEHLQRHFHEFYYTGIHASRQTDILIDRVPGDTPFFALLNFGETHAPYRFDPTEGTTGPQVSPGRVQRAVDAGFDSSGWASQISCLEFLDSHIATIFNHLQSLEHETILIVCGDHGECFGEEGLYGHGFYHPSVMEVPLAIFDSHGELLTHANDIMS